MPDLPTTNTQEYDPEMILAENRFRRIHGRILWADEEEALRQLIKFTKEHNGKRTLALYHFALEALKEEEKDSSHKKHTRPKYAP